MQLVVCILFLIIDQFTGLNIIFRVYSSSVGTGWL